MSSKKSILKPDQILSASVEAKKKLNSVSKKMGTKDLFVKKVEKAKRTFHKISALPF